MALSVTSQMGNRTDLLMQALGTASTYLLARLGKFLGKSQSPKHTC